MGQRQWFHHHGLDFRDYLKNGMPISKLPKDDAASEDVARRVLEREKRR